MICLMRQQTPLNEKFGFEMDDTYDDTSGVAAATASGEGGDVQALFF